VTVPGHYPRTVDELIMILLTLPADAHLTVSEVGRDGPDGWLTITVVYPYPLPEQAPR